MWHRSRIDSVALLSIAALIVTGLFAVFAVFSGRGIDGWPAALCLAGLFIALPAWVLLDTRYRIDGTWLRVRCGPIRQRIRRADIASVERHTMPLIIAPNAPALSSDRLCLRDRTGRLLMMISPQRPEAFLRQLDLPRTAPAVDASARS